MDEDIPQDLVDHESMPKHFWAFPVYNYTDERVQILEVTQKTIQKEMRVLTNNPDWGNPLGYDISVTRTGEELKTEYSVQPSPPSELDPGVVKLYEDMSINLEALFDGEDPFASGTQGLVDEVETALESKEEAKPWECTECGETVPTAVQNYSESAFGRVMCMNCQGKMAKEK